MSSPLFDMMGNSPMTGPMGQMQQFMTQFKQFKQNFEGDPHQEVQKLLNSGQLSQQQYNQLQQMASQITHMMGG